jgi:hypothetical protein
MDLQFAQPLVLFALLGLPLLWLLLRLSPPAPLRLRFPGIALLQDLLQQEQTPARTPWWLLLLRLAIVTLIILGIAQPLYNPPASLAGAGPLLLVVDNSWASAPHWAQRQQAMLQLVDQAGREQRDIMLLPTAADAETGKQQLIGPGPVASLRPLLEKLSPQSWPSDHAAALQLLQTQELPSALYAVWFSDGLRQAGSGDLQKFLQTRGALAVFGLPDDPIYVLQLPILNGAAVSLTITRTPPDQAASVTVQALDARGGVVARLAADFTPGNSMQRLDWQLPADIRNQISSFALENYRSAATTVLLDERWRRHKVGLSGDAKAMQESPLLTDIYYPQRAVQQIAETAVAGWHDLLAQKISLLIVTHNLPYNKKTDDLRRWIEAGGVLVRFAGPSLQDEASFENALIPVRLRAGDRALGGSLSWATPQPLAAFAANSPFAGLAIPDDVTVSRQVLAEPTTDLPDKSWAQLRDGTPLVTAQKMGAGWVVLFHVPAKADWSSLPLSGLFVEMLQRLVGLSQGVGDPQLLGNLPAMMALDGFGKLQNPPATVLPLVASDLSKTSPAALHPPGYYGTPQARFAFNLGGQIGDLQRLSDVTMQPLDQTLMVQDLRPWLLTAALLLLLVDWLVALALRGLMKKNLAIAAAIALFVLCTTPVQAAVPSAALTTTLAYVKTGDRLIDQTSLAGLQGLVRVLQDRTALDDIVVAAVDPAQDELAFYPLIYWPISAAQDPVDAATAERINDYLTHGGMLLIDTREGETPQASLQLRRIFAAVTIPSLTPMPNEHVLSRAFYLLNDMPGRVTGAPLWLEPEAAARNDGVASVLVGGNDWAAAWAVDNKGKPMHAVIPGGERQREIAYRFGVNLVIYALTGNYKADQVHVTAILDRLDHE